MANGSPSLPPGFRFHPTDEELILHYLRKRTASPPCPLPIIADVDIYKFNPWELPEKAKFGDREWYFFSPRDRKYPNGVRPNRSAASGYWKATGTDKPITTSKGNENIGVKKALVFYKGKPPKGVKTNWIMHEYRLLDSPNRSITSRAVMHREDRMRLDDWVLCRIYQKTNHQPLAAADQEQEEAAAEEAIAKNSKSNSSMHKSFSLSELLIVEEADFSLLSRLIETPLNCAIPDQASVLSNANSRMSSRYLTSQAIESEENSLKRRRIAANCSFDGYENFLNSSVKQLNSSSLFYDQLVNQFDLSQSFFYQQPTLNSRFGIP